MSKPDVLIIGGGVIGSAIAYELQREGAQVTLLERTSIASGASGVSAAMLEAQLDAREEGPFTELALASRALFPDLSQQLNEFTGIDIGYEACGILRLATDDAERRLLRDRLEWQQARGLSAEWLEPDVVALRFPALGGRNTGALFYKDDGQVIASRFTTGLAEGARQYGAVIREGIQVTGFKTNGRRVTEVLTDQGAMSAGQVILAAGPWSAGLARRLNFSLPIEPVRGQMLIYKTVERLLPAPVYTSEGYFTPKIDGTLLVGSTAERVGFTCETTPLGIEKLQSFATKRLPILIDIPYAAAVAGLRPGSLPDNLPAIGPVPDWDNVSVAAGHYRNGILLAPITAKLPLLWQVQEKNNVVGILSPVTGNSHGAMGILKSSKKGLSIQEAASKGLGVSARAAGWTLSHARFGRLPAVKVVSSLKNDPSQKMVQYYVQAGDDLFLIQCVAPASEWNAYSGLFATMIRTFQFSN